MEKRDIKIGETYLAKVSGKLVPVWITNESHHGGWNAVNAMQEGRDLAVAERALRDVLLLDPENPAAKQNLAVLLRQTGRVA
jgi:hypothetical protein